MLFDSNLGFIFCNFRDEINYSENNNIELIVVIVVDWVVRKVSLWIVFGILKWIWLYGVIKKCCWCIFRYGGEVFCVVSLFCVILYFKVDLEIVIIVYI